MKAAKRKKLEAQGWRVGTAQEFLRLTNAEAAFIERKLALSERFKKLLREKSTRKVGLSRETT